MLLLTISWFLFGLYALLIICYCIGWYRKCPIGTIPLSYIPQTSVSVLIPARNEAEHIGQCLQSILDNDYPEDLVEIIVIDDYSTDRTASIAQTTLKNKNGKVLL